MPDTRMPAVAALNSGATRDWESAWLATSQTVPARPLVAVWESQTVARSAPALRSVAAAPPDWPANIGWCPNQSRDDLSPVATAAAHRPWPAARSPLSNSHSIQKFVPLAARARSLNQASP